MKAREIVARLKKDGWYQVGQAGSHAQFKHPEKPGRVTVPIHSGDLPIRVIVSIERQSGISLR